MTKVRSCVTTAWLFYESLVRIKKLIKFGELPIRFKLVLLCYVTEKSVSRLSMLSDYAIRIAPAFILG